MSSRRQIDDDARPRRVLAIAPQPFFSPRGTPFSVYYRTMVTARFGLRVDLLTYGQGQDVDIPGVRIIRTPALRFLGPVKIGPSWQKAVHDVFMLLWTIALLLRRRYAFVHAHEEAVFWCRFLKPLLRFKMVYDMHSSLPQQLTNFKFTKSKLLIGMFHRLEDGALKAADGVITICPDLRDYALSRGIDPARHFLIENSIFDDVRLKTDAGEPADAPTPVIATTGPRIVYAGTFEPYQGIDLLIDGFAQVAASRPGVQLLLVGGSPPQVEAMKRRAAAAGLGGRCVFTGQVSKPAARELLATADVLVSPRREGTNTPLKVYELLASGKPLVATNIYSHTQVLTDDVCFLADPTPAGMAAGLSRALDDRSEAARRVAGARHLYESAYSRQAYEQKMRDLLAVLGVDASAAGVMPAEAR